MSSEEIPLVSRKSSIEGEEKANKSSSVEEGSKRSSLWSTFRTYLTREETKESTTMEGEKDAFGGVEMKRNEEETITTHQEGEEERRAIDKKANESVPANRRATMAPSYGKAQSGQNTNSQNNSQISSLPNTAPPPFPFNVHAYDVSGGSAAAPRVLPNMPPPTPTKTSNRHSSYFGASSSTPQASKTPREPVSLTTGGGGGASAVVLETTSGSGTKPQQTLYGSPYVSAVMLSLWDFSSGPRPEQIWVASPNVSASGSTSINPNSQSTGVPTREEWLANAGGDNTDAAVPVSYQIQITDHQQLGPKPRSGSTSSKNASRTKDKAALNDRESDSIHVDGAGTDSNSNAKLRDSRATGGSDDHSKKSSIASTHANDSLESSSTRVHGALPLKSLEHDFLRPGSSSHNDAEHDPQQQSTQLPPPSTRVTKMLGSGHGQGNQHLNLSRQSGVNSDVEGHRYAGIFSDGEDDDETLTEMIDEDYIEKKIPIGRKALAARLKHVPRVVSAHPKHAKTNTASSSSAETGNGENSGIEPHARSSEPISNVNDENNDLRNEGDIDSSLKGEEEEGNNGESKSAPVSQRRRSYSMNEVKISSISEIEQESQGEMKSEAEGDEERKNLKSENPDNEAFSEGEYGSEASYSYSSSSSSDAWDDEDDDEDDEDGENESCSSSDSDNGHHVEEKIFSSGDISAIASHIAKYTLGSSDLAELVSAPSSTSSSSNPSGIMMDPWNITSNNQSGHGEAGAMGLGGAGVGGSEANSHPVGSTVANVFAGGGDDDFSLFGDRGTSSNAKDSHSNASKDGSGATGNFGGRNSSNAGPGGGLESGDAMNNMDEGNAKGSSATSTRNVGEDDDEAVNSLGIEHKLHVFQHAPYFTFSAVFTAPYNVKITGAPSHMQGSASGATSFGDQTNSAFSASSSAASGASSTAANANGPPHFSAEATKFAFSLLLPQSAYESFARHYAALLDRLNQWVVVYVYLCQLRPQHALPLMHKEVVRSVMQINRLLGCEGIPLPPLKQTLFALAKPQSHDSSSSNVTPNSSLTQGSTGSGLGGSFSNSNSSLNSTFQQFGTPNFSTNPNFANHLGPNFHNGTAASSLPSQANSSSAISRSSAQLGGATSSQSYSPHATNAGPGMPSQGIFSPPGSPSMTSNQHNHLMQSHPHLFAHQTASDYSSANLTTSGDDAGFHSSTSVSLSMSFSPSALAGGGGSHPLDGPINSPSSSFADIPPFYGDPAAAASTGNGALLPSSLLRPSSSITAASMSHHAPNGPYNANQTSMTPTSPRRAQNSQFDENFTNHHPSQFAAISGHSGLSASTPGISSSGMPNQASPIPIMGSERGGSANLSGAKDFGAFSGSAYAGMNHPNGPLHSISSASGSNTVHPDLADPKKTRDFLSLILTSHFQTHQRTVILGEDLEMVNLYVSTLALFLSPEDRQRSRFATYHNIPAHLGGQTFTPQKRSATSGAGSSGGASGANFSGEAPFVATFFPQASNQNSKDSKDGVNTNASSGTSSGAPSSGKLQSTVYSNSRPDVPAASTLTALSTAGFGISMPTTRSSSSTSGGNAQGNSATPISALPGPPTNTNGSNTFIASVNVPATSAPSPSAADFRHLRPTTRRESQITLSATGSNPSGLNGASSGSSVPPPPPPPLPSHAQAQANQFAWHYFHQHFYTDGYVADLCLQGVHGNHKLVRNSAYIQGQMPVTLVDLNRKIVTQTHPFHQFRLLRCEFHQAVLFKLLRLKRSNLWTSQETLFQAVKEPSVLIRKIVLESFRLPEQLILPYITISLKNVMARTYTLVKYVEGLENGSPGMASATHAANLAATANAKDRNANFESENSKSTFGAPSRVGSGETPSKSGKLAKASSSTQNHTASNALASSGANLNFFPSFQASSASSSHNLNLNPPIPAPNNAYYASGPAMPAHSDPYSDIQFSDNQSSNPRYGARSRAGSGSSTSSSIIAPSSTHSQATSSAASNATNSNANAFSSSFSVAMGLTPSTSSNNQENAESTDLNADGTATRDALPSPHSYHSLTSVFASPPPNLFHHHHHHIYQHNHATSGANATHGMALGEIRSNPSLLKRIRHDLDLEEPCFTALLGIAELLKPGIFRALFGDPMSQEKKWIELFEGL